MGKVEVHSISALNRNAALEQPIIEDYDVARIAPSKAFRFDAEMHTKKTILFQIDFNSLDNTDATVILRHSNNGKAGTFKDIIGLSPITLGSANGTDYLEAIDFSGGFIECLVTLNSVTSGTIGIHALAKD